MARVIIKSLNIEWVYKGCECSFLKPKISECSFFCGKINLCIKDRAEVKGNKVLLRILFDFIRTSSKFIS